MEYGASLSAGDSIIPAYRTYTCWQGLDITRSNHVWAADITHIPMAQGFFVASQSSWTGQAVWCCPGGYRTRWTALSASTPWRKPLQYMEVPPYSTPIRAVSLHRMYSPRSFFFMILLSVWMARNDEWTICSLNGYGKVSSTKICI